uniref:Uncharacterized protein n=1 Tax=Rhizophora mucronata TaxID=61149 RepID=A0A2P2PX44_RHIMU
MYFLIMCVYIYIKAHTNSNEGNFYLTLIQIYWTGKNLMYICSL